MFGCVVADHGRLTPEEKQRYRACYCGLCRALKKTHGQGSRLCLNYDMTFLILLLSSLYEPEEQAGQERCFVHPRRRHDYWITEFSAYAASMNAALAWHKCLDDWQDEKKLSRLLQSQLFARPAKQAARRWPRQCAAMKQSLQNMAALEENGGDADALCAEFGNLMGELFVYQEDEHWAPVLRAFGKALGAFIYLLDAVCDLEEDRKQGRFNPLLTYDQPGTYFHPHLMLLMGDAAAEFEKLPLVQDADLLRNILYSGVWCNYNRQFQAPEKEEANQ